MSDTPLLELNKAIIDLDRELAQKTKEYDEYKQACLEKKRCLLSKINIEKHSLDIKKFELGLSLLDLQFPIRGTLNTLPRRYNPIYTQLVSAAKYDLSNNAQKLSREYIGQKYYQAFDQRCDCEYGYGPSHGSIYQRIGLRNPKRALTDYDIECCLYLLENIDVALENLNKSQEV